MKSWCRRYWLTCGNPGLNLESSRATAEPVTSFADILRAIQPAGTVVAIRFHNVLGSLKLGKPTIAISYSPKHDALMADMGVPEFSQPVHPFDLDLLIQRFTELEERSAELSQVIMKHNAVNEQLLESQFAELFAALFPELEPVQSAEGARVS